MIIFINLFITFLLFVNINECIVLNVLFIESNMWILFGIMRGMPKLIAHLTQLINDWSTRAAWPRTRVVERFFEPHSYQHKTLGRTPTLHKIHVFHGIQITLRSSQLIMGGINESTRVEWMGSTWAVHSSPLHSTQISHFQWYHPMMRFCEAIYVK